MRKFLIAAVFAALLQLGMTSAEAAGKPLALTLSPATQTVTEGQSATLALAKSGGNGKLSLVRITTSDGSFSASAYPGSAIVIPTKDDAVVNGTRTVKVTATASTGATAAAAIVVLDNDLPPSPTPLPAWTKCADENGTCTISGTADVRYGSGTVWATRTITGSVACTNAVFGDPLPGTVKECDTTASVIAPAPPPPPPLPPVPTQTCPDGSVIPATSICPAPVPTPAPSSGCPILSDPRWHGGGAIAHSETLCTAVKNCPSVWQNARTIAANITLPSVVAGQVYSVTPMVDGLLPSGYTGTAVGAERSPQSPYGDAQFDRSCFGA